MALKDDINNLPSTIGEGNSGHLNNHQTIHAALKDHEGRIVRNESAVPAGLELKKDTTVGTRIMVGTTTIYGDTGWRDITALLNPQPNSGKLRIRRVADAVYVQFYYLVFNAGVTATFTVPSGWSGDVNHTQDISDWSGNRTGYMRLDYAGNGVIGVEKSSGSHHIATIPAGAWPNEMVGQ